MNASMKMTLIAVVLGGLAPSAYALDVLSTSATNPVGNCQAALPAYEGQTRKRPLAVINEGVNTAFVTCAFTTEQLSLGVVTFATRLTNLSDVSATTNCTAVTGEEGSAEYFLKSLTLAPGATGVLQWSGADTGGLLFDRRVAISCSLPPMVGLNNNAATVLLSII